ncbi:single-stranded-DNA-specific exonuclease RecJ [Mediterraneibacter sp.]|mgnify:CR=1 FL=1|uniref:single-stranded-DNA-specific exonuclease RecJ n=1 Tax=Mediterraneibacter sp. TaxID=2316022 RepID=UPI0027B94F7B|nr:single-stranded-DNA-specific exonuclease RecJ [Mediterraneibacter sp.]
MERWYITMKKADFARIGAKYNLSPIIARLIRNRDIIEENEIDFYLNGTIADLYDGMLMKDMDKAIEILSEKIREEKPIRVIGDYDIDGVNASYILREGLSGLGADVDTDIPDRIKDGYGLNKMLIDRALEDGIDTIITCDNGIAAAEEIAYGKKRGLTVIVTDHHQVPFVDMNGEREYILPQADAVVDPKRFDCEYPFKNLCGAAVAYKLIEALYNVMLRDPEDVDYLMENVAIATVGDVVDLKGENRIFVKQGIEMLKRTKNEGLKALIECTGIKPEGLNSYHLGFVIGPCINASGRLDTAKRALELLSARTRRDAVMLAEDLKALNDSRKEMTERGIKEAVEIIESTSLKEDKVLVVYLPDSHESIAGIIAGRIRERYGRPTIILTKAEEGVKGSGRSIEEYDMFTELCKCQALFTKFGGHRQAAGVSLKEENIQRFRDTINSLCTLTEEDLQTKVFIDMQVPFPYLTESLIEQFEVLEPFGQGNRRPLFAEKDLKVLWPKIVGKNRNVLQCTLEDKQGNRMRAVYYGDVETCLEDMQTGKVTAVTYFPLINEYKGTRSIQLKIVNYQKK